MSGLRTMLIGFALSERPDLDEVSAEWAVEQVMHGPEMYGKRVTIESATECFDLIRARLHGTFADYPPEEA